jgi:cytosine/adenosine deaminase-related metal-dependent hydrolase
VQTANLLGRKIGDVKSSHLLAVIFQVETDAYLTTGRHTDQTISRLIAVLSPPAKRHCALEQIAVNRTDQRSLESPMTQLRWRHNHYLPSHELVPVPIVRKRHELLEGSAVCRDHRSFPYNGRIFTALPFYNTQFPRVPNTGGTLSTLLVKNATLVATMDDADTRWEDGAIYVRDNQIVNVGPTTALPKSAQRVIDARGMAVVPGLVNTHHHFFQTLTRAIPSAQNSNLFNWLKTLYPIWAGLTAASIRVSTEVSIAELMQSGCTTAADHTYLWPGGARLDDQIEVAAMMGMRFHAGRGSMSLGESQGGLPPDSVVEYESDILRDSRRLVETFHDSRRFAMTRVVLAPCSPFSVSLDLMRESISLARAYGVHSHTHTAETLHEERFSLEQFGRRPIELMEDLGWMGADVWHAHVVHASPDEAQRLGSTRTGIAHCPTSNMRLGSGIAPLAAFRESGARVGLGVDGSASNDGSHMLNEARQAMLLHRVGGNPAALTAHEALWLATRGGAAVLGRDDIGYLAPGMAADFIGYRVDTLGMSGGAVHDPLAALVFCQPQAVDLSVIDGKLRVQHGRLLGIDVQDLVARHNAAARALVRGEAV